MKMENGFWFLEHENVYDKENETFKEYKDRELYYDHNKKMWVKREEYTGNWYPATFPCRSYRAAKRHLRKHNEIPKGTTFRLCSKYVGFDRYLTKQ